MTTELWVLNLSQRSNPLAPDPAWVRPSKEITLLRDVPGNPPESLVLYVVGHGVQHGLVDGTNKVLDESVVAATIRRAREGLPTVLIWDSCFAESMLKIGDGAAPALIAPKDDASWPSNFIHIFSCRSYERTWHSPVGQVVPALTVFSRELGLAIKALPAQGTWAQLETLLQRQLDGLQTPRVVAPARSSTTRTGGGPPGGGNLSGSGSPVQGGPDDFELKKLLALRSTDDTAR